MGCGASAQQGLPAPQPQHPQPCDSKSNDVQSSCTTALPPAPQSPPLEPSVSVSDPSSSEQKPPFSAPSPTQHAPSSLTQGLAHQGDDPRESQTQEASTPQPLHTSAAQPLKTSASQPLDTSIPGPGGVEELHSKFFQDATFSGRRAKLGSISDFDKGIEDVVGKMANQPLRMMFTEHILNPDSDIPFKASNAASETTPKKEWLFVVGNGVDLTTWELRLDKATPQTEGISMERGRNAKSLQQIILEASDSIQQSGLETEELISLRLYTGPLFQKYNRVLRSKGDRERTDRNLYSATINLIVSGLMKLSRIYKPPPFLYRGMGNIALDSEFFRPDAQGYAGAVEPGFMSTTTDRQVALEYSGVSRGKHLPTLLELSVGKTSTGSNVQFLSQFEYECEILFPPLTHLQVLETRLESVEGVANQISVIGILPTTNQHFMTVAVAREERKQDLKKLASSLIADLQLECKRESPMVDSEDSIEGLKQSLVKDIEIQDPEWYHDNYKYQSMLKEVVDKIEHAREDIRAGKPLPGELLKSEEETLPSSSVPDIGESQTDRGGTVGKDVASLHQDMGDKFTQTPGFALRSGVFGDMKVYDQGISRHFGSLDVQPGKAMYMEHCSASDSQQEFKPSNASTSTTPIREWEFVVGVDGLDLSTWQVRFEAQLIPGKSVPLIMGVERTSKNLKELLHTEEAKNSGLQVWECIALRLYSGPMFARYNSVMRKMHKLRISGNLYSNTIQLIISGLLKLCRISTPPADFTVYRGMGGVQLPKTFLEKDNQGFCGGCELAFMSTSKSKEVALHYSKGKAMRTLFKIRMGKTSTGADLSWISQVPGEAEVLFPPFTHLEIVGKPVKEDELSIFTLRPTINQGFQTIEKAQSSRRQWLRHMALSLSWDVWQWGIIQQIELSVDKQLHDLRTTVEEQATNEELNINVFYTNMIEKLLAASEQQRFKLAEDFSTKGDTNKGEGDLNQAVTHYKRAIDCLEDLCSMSSRRQDKIVHLRQQVLQLSGEDSSESVKANNLYMLACDLVDAGNDRAAIPHFHQAKDPNGPEACFHSLTQCLHDLIPLPLGQALEGFSSLHGTEHEDIVKVHSSLGSVYEDLQEFDQASEHYEQALAMNVKLHEYESEQVAGSLNNLGVVYQNSGRKEEALAKHKESLRIKQLVLTQDHVDLAYSLTNLGLVSLSMEDFDSSIKYLEESLRIKRKEFGAQHPEVARNLLNIGAALHDQNKFDEALTRYEAAVKILKVALSPQHIDCVNAEYNVACAYKDIGRFEEARALFLRCGEVFKQVYGPDSESAKEAEEDATSCLSSSGPPQ